MKYIKVQFLIFSLLLSSLTFTMEQKAIHLLQQTLESDYGNLLNHRSKAAQIRYIVLPNQLEKELYDQIKQVSDQYTQCYYDVDQFKNYVPLYSALKRTLQKLSGSAQNKKNYDDCFHALLSDQKKHCILFDKLYPCLTKANDCLQLNEPRVSQALMKIQECIVLIEKNELNFASCISIFKNQFSEIFDRLLIIHELRPLSKPLTYRAAVTLLDIIEIANNQQCLTSEQKQKFKVLFFTIDYCLDNKLKTAINNL